MLINILYGSKLTDSATCFKLINGDLARKINFSSNGFSLDFEIICKVICLGYTVDEITVSYKQRSREQGKKIKAMDGIISLIVILSERFKTKKSIGLALNKISRKARAVVKSNYTWEKFTSIIIEHLNLLE